MRKVGDKALAGREKRRVRTTRLTDNSDFPGGNEGGVIEAILRRKPEFLFWRQGRKLCADANGSVVGEDPENTLRLFTIIIIFVRSGRQGRVCAVRFRLRVFFSCGLRERRARQKRESEGNRGAAVPSQAQTAARRQMICCRVRRSCWDRV